MQLILLMCANRHVECTIVPTFSKLLPHYPLYPFSLTKKLPKALHNLTKHFHSPNCIHIDGVVVTPLCHPGCQALDTWCYVGHVFGGAEVRFSRPLSCSLGRERDTTAGVDPLTARAYNRSSSGTKDVARREFVSILGGGSDDDNDDPDQGSDTA